MSNCIHSTCIHKQQQTISREKVMVLTAIETYPNNLSKIIYYLSHFGNIIIGADFQKSKGVKSEITAQFSIIKISNES